MGNSNVSVKGIVINGGENINSNNEAVLMNISDEEYFALVFTIQDGVESLNIMLNTAEASERKRTGIGFFSTITFRQPLSVKNFYEKYWECTFEHNKMPYGGCFMIRLVAENILEIEAIAFESTWPESFCKEDFIM